MTEDFHRALRESLGAYVLGHLDPAEEDAVRVHLATCDECRAELAELQPVANALAIARHRPVTGAVTPRSLQRRVSDAVAAEAGRRRRSRLVTSLTTLTAAAALVIVAALGVTTFLDRTPDAPVPEAVAVQVADDLEQVTATAGVIAHTWGTEVKLTTAGLQAGATFEAFVLGEDGTEARAGTFTAIGDETMNCNLQAYVRRDQAGGFEIRDLAGEVVISSTF